MRWGRLRHISYKASGTSTLLHNLSLLILRRYRGLRVIPVCGRTSDLLLMTRPSFLAHSRGAFSTPDAFSTVNLTLIFKGIFCKPQVPDVRHQLKIDIWSYSLHCSSSTDRKQLIQFGLANKEILSSDAEKLRILGIHCLSRKSRGNSNIPDRHSWIVDTLHRAWVGHIRTLSRYSGRAPSSYPD